MTASWRSTWLVFVCPSLALVSTPWRDVREKDVPESLENLGDDQDQRSLDEGCLCDEGQQPGLVAKVVGRVRFRPSQAGEWKPFEVP